MAGDVCSYLDRSAGYHRLSWLSHELQPLISFAVGYWCLIKGLTQAAYTYQSHPSIPGDSLRCNYRTAISDDLSGHKADPSDLSSDLIDAH